MCFGLTNARTTFCRLTDQLFGDIEQTFCPLHIEEFLIYSRTFGSHLEHVRTVLHRFQEASLKIEPTKCSFAEKKTTFLGHTGLAERTHLGDSKICGVNNSSRPHNLRTVRPFGSDKFTSVVLFKTTLLPLNLLPC